MSDAIASGGNFAALASTRVHAWNQDDGFWHLSPLLSKFGGIATGSDGNFAASVPNRIHAFSRSDSSWNQSVQITSLGLVEGSAFPLCAPGGCGAGACDICNPELGCLAAPLPECSISPEVPSLTHWGIAGLLSLLVSIGSWAASGRELRAR